MFKLLLDANISPKTREYLEKRFNFDIIDLITENKQGLSDEQVIKFAEKEKRVIITFDLDFGEIYYFNKSERIGVIILRLKDQTVESVNKILEKFFQKEAKSIDLNRSLVVIDESKIRIVPNNN